MASDKDTSPLLREQPCQLSAWLAIATRDLVPSAQARVRAEIEAHYAEAVRVRRKAGASEAAANTAALADLGDAKRAARRFRREHLTAKEARALTRFFKDVGDPRLTWFLTLGLPVGVVLMRQAQISPEPLSWTWRAVLLLVYLALLTSRLVSHRMARLPATLARGQNMLAMCLLIPLAFCAIMLAYAEFTWDVYAGLMLVGGIGLGWYIRLRRSWRRAVNEGIDCISISRGI